MKFSIILSSVAMTATGLVAAATIPTLNNLDSWGFVNLDVDGVLRSWSSNGTVLDAAPLDPDQIAAFITLREGVVDAQVTTDEKATFANINGLDVPTAQLFNPPEDVFPVEDIANAEGSRLAHGGVLPVAATNSLEARACVPAYCYGQNYYCEIYVGCSACYGYVCFGLMGS
jgi:hypothetical protein